MLLWIKENLRWIMDYRDEIFLMVLILLFILMLILLRTVRKNLRMQTEQNGRLEQIVRLWGDTLKEDIKVMQDVHEKEIQTEKISGQNATDSEELVRDAEQKKQQQKEEEIFGKVLQEYFP